MNKAAFRQTGVSLVEVMVALALGLFVSAGALSLMLGNRQANRTTEALARVQESTRVAFDLMSRDLRSIGINACSGGVRVMNVLNNPTDPTAPGYRWWADWSGGLRGFDDTAASTAATIGTAAQQRVAATDMLEMMRGAQTTIPVRAHDAASAVMTLEKPNDQPHGYRVGDLVAVCDYVDTAIFQVTAIDTAANSITHASTSGTPGNCSAALGFRSSCAASVSRVFTPGSTVMKFEPVAWYVGNNGRSGPANSPLSLFRVSVQSDGAGMATAVPEEIVEGVTGMQLQYMYVDPATGAGTYRNAVDVPDWRRVTGVQIVLTIQSPESGVAEGNARIQRQLTHVVNFRNRVE